MRDVRKRAQRARRAARDEGDRRGGRRGGCRGGCRGEWWRPPWRTRVRGVREGGDGDGGGARVASTRAFDGRVVTVAYFSVDEYRAAFGKGVPPRTDEERQEAALRALEYLANEDFDAAATGGALPPREGNAGEPGKRKVEPAANRVKTHILYSWKENPYRRDRRERRFDGPRSYKYQRVARRARSSSRPSNARRIFRRVGSSIIPIGDASVVPWAYTCTARVPSLGNTLVAPRRDARWVLRRGSHAYRARREA